MKMYFLIAIVMTMLTLLDAKLRPDNDKDIFQLLKEMANEIENMRDIGYPKIANFVENLINSAVEGNIMPIILFIFTLYLIPIFRWILFIKVIFKK